MLISQDIVRAISKIRPPEEHVDAFIDGFNGNGERFGLHRPHRLAQFVAQIMHESGGLKHVREIWGPTPTQKKYEGRKDLGNVNPGDGAKYRGYGFIQVTGRANVSEFYGWARRPGLALVVPDFIASPHLIATMPWSTMSAIWYWETRGLNTYADRGDIEMITRKINGGLNGYQDRLDYFVRAGLVICGYGVKDVEAFQRDAGLQADGIAGPRTREALHATLSAIGEEVA